MRYHRGPNRLRRLVGPICASADSPATTCCTSTPGLTGAAVAPSAGGTDELIEQRGASRGRHRRQGEYELKDLLQNLGKSRCPIPVAVAIDFWDPGYADVTSRYNGWSQHLR